jgi:hypothetical protein
MGQVCPKTPNAPKHTGQMDSTKQNRSMNGVSQKQTNEKPVSKCASTKNRFTKPTSAFLNKATTSPVDPNNADEDWLHVDLADVPAADSGGQETDPGTWETVEVARTNVRCNLTGEDSYAIDYIRS